MNPTSDRPNPFIGPRPFREEEQLYGRERETGQLFNLVLAERVVLLYSPSGAGKTSLLRASLLPRLRGRRFNVLPVLRVNLAPNPAFPASNRYLYSVLTDLEEAYPEAQRLPEAELAAMRLVDYLAARTPERSVLIFDQFEEILTLDPTDTQAKQEFFNQVGEALQEPSRFTVFAMREDYLAGLEPYLRPLPNRLKATFRLDLLGKAAAQEVVERTAHQGGVDFSAEAAARLVEDLSRVQVMQPDGNLTAVAGAYVEPVQLQVVGYNLWQKLRPDQTAIALDELDQIGNVDISLAEYYAARVRSVAQTTGEGERWIRRWFERKLITESGIRGQVLMEPEVSGGLSNAAIRLLEDAHLVRRDTRRGTTWFELTHDRLLNPVQQDNTAWFNTHLSLLQRQAELWRDQGMRDDLLLRENALLEVEAWADTHATELSELEGDFLRKCRAVRQLEQERLEHERKQRRRLQIYTVTAVAAAVVAIALVFIALGANRRANAARVEADNNARKAYAAEQQALEARDEAEAQRKEAETQRRQAEQSAEAAKRERAAAEYEQGIARAGELAAEARLASPAYPQRSLLLAVEAARSAQPFDDRHPATMQALMQGLSLAGGGAEGSTYEEIYDMNISPTGRFLVVEYASVLRFYDLASGQPTLLSWLQPDQLGLAEALFFSPSERWLFDSSTFRLYNLNKPDPLDVPVLDLGVQRGAVFENIRSVLFIDNQAGSDSEWLAILMPDELWLVDLDDAKLPIRRIPISDAGEMFSLRASPPDEKGASRWLWLQTFGSQNPTVNLVDLQAVQQDREALIQLPEGTCSGALDFSIGGERLYGLNQADGSLCYWDLAAAGFPARATDLNDLIFIDDSSNDIGRMALAQEGGRPGPFQRSRISRGLANVLQAQDGLWSTWDLREAQPVLDTVALELPEPPLATGEHPFAPIRLRSSDGRYLLQATEKKATLLDLAGDSPGSAFNLEGYSYIQVPRRFSPDGRWLLTGCYDSQACLYDLSRANPGQDPIVLGGHESWIGLYAFSQDGSRLVTASADTSIRLWNLNRSGFFASPLRLGQVPEETDFPILAVSSNSRWLFYVQSLWDLAPLARGGEPDQITLPGVEALVAVFSPDNRWLAFATEYGKSIVNTTASQDAVVYLLDLQSQANDFKDGLYTLLSSEIEISGLAFSPDNRWLADTSGQLWYLPEVQSSTQEPPARSIPSGSVTFTSDSQALVTVTDDGSVHWLSLDATRKTMTVESGFSFGAPLAISPDGSWLVTREESYYELWKLDGEQNSSLIWSWPASDFGYLQFSPDSRLLAVADGQTFNLIDLTGEIPTEVPDTGIDGTPPEVSPTGTGASQVSTNAMQYSAGGKWFINSDAYFERISLFGALSLPLKASMPVVSLSGSGLGYIAQGSGVGGGGGGGGIGLDIQTFQSAYLWPVDALFNDPDTVPTALGGHNGEIQSFLVSQDETWAVTLSSDRQLRLWDLLTATRGEALQPVLLPEAESSISALGFTPDSRWLATADSGGRVNLWPLESARLEIAACQAAGRNLTITEWQRYFPNEPYRKTCSNLPLHTSVASAVSADMVQLVAGRNYEEAIRLGRELVEQEPFLPKNSIDWFLVCKEAAYAFEYDIVRSACEAAGIEENPLQAEAALEDARTMITQGEYALAAEALSLAQTLDPTVEAPYELLCREAVTAGAFDDVRKTCEEHGLSEQVALWSYQLDRIETLLRVNYEYEQATQQMAQAIRQEPDFAAYAAQADDLVGELCSSQYFSGGDISPIQRLCDTVYVEGLPFRATILLARANDEYGAGNIMDAIELLAQAEDIRQELGAPPKDIFSFGMYDFCSLAISLDQLQAYRKTCELAGVEIGSLLRDLRSEEVYDRLNDLMSSGDYAGGSQFLLNVFDSGYPPDQTQVFEFCQLASQAGQYGVVETACTLYGFDPLGLELYSLLSEMDDLLDQRRIDAALLKLTKILQQFPAYQIPDDAWSSLCSAGVTAGQYYKVKDACMRVPQPQG